VIGALAGEKMAAILEVGKNSIYDIFTWSWFLPWTSIHIMYDKQNLLEKGSMRV